MKGTLLGLWIFFLLCTTASAAQSAIADSDSTDLASAEAKLRAGAAPPDALTRFEAAWQQQWPEDQKALSDYILGLSTEGLRKYIQILSQASVDDQYTRGPDYQERPEVPKGIIIQMTLDHSAIFPGTTHDTRVYIPAEYRGEHPAPVHVQLDGLFSGIQTAFDNLIQDHEIPPLIAIGIKPGVVAPSASQGSKRYNRSLEFDGLSDDLARFIIYEVFPAVERLRTPEGFSLHLSRDPNDHSIAGFSTGGIGSFTAAWQRPDIFRRVYTGIGTFVGMRGGDHYPVLVRKTEPKPLRIFMQDGSLDELTDFIGEVGDWWLGNQTMLSALQFAGYQVEHVWGEGSHNSNHPIAAFPEALRWLWKDWPAPVVAGPSHNNLLNDIVVPDNGWAPVPAAEARTISFGETSTGYQVVSPGGRRYFTDTHKGRVFVARPEGQSLLLDKGLKSPTGIAVSPDGSWLAVAESPTHWGYGYRIEPDGRVTARQRFYWFHVPDDADDSGAGGLVMDSDGRLYAATRLGVQVFDHNGRVRAILPLPRDSVASSIAFGGSELSTLYVRTRDGRMFGRLMRVHGMRSGAVVAVVPDWGAG